MKTYLNKKIKKYINTSNLKQEIDFDITCENEKNATHEFGLEI